MGARDGRFFLGRESGTLPRRPSPRAGIRQVPFSKPDGHDVPPRGYVVYGLGITATLNPRR